MEVHMDFLEFAKKRYSVRKFSDKEVEQENLDKILEAGRVAPTASNFQPQRILVFNTENNLNKLKSCTPCSFDAPLVLLICFDKTASWKRPNDGKGTGEIDASIVTTHMILEVASLGLGSTWVERFDLTAIISAFELPENIIPVALLPIGYPDKNVVPNLNHTKRFSINETVFYNSFANL
jgi:nitroreductase